MPRKTHTQSGFADFAALVENVDFVDEIRKTGIKKPLQSVFAPVSVTVVIHFYEETKISLKRGKSGKELFSQQFIAYFYNITGSHSYQQISLRAILQKKFFNLIKRRKVVTVMSEFTYFFLQCA
mgnify:FL=1